MIDFNKAINVAEDNAKALLKNATNFQLEGVVTSSDNKNVEVTLSYDLEGKDPLSLEGNVNKAGDSISSLGLAHLSSIMRRRKEYKIFIVSRKDAEFKGFKRSQEH